MKYIKTFLALVFIMLYSVCGYSATTTESLTINSDGTVINTKPTITFTNNLIFSGTTSFADSINLLFDVNQFTAVTNAVTNITMHIASGVTLTNPIVEGPVSFSGGGGVYSTNLLNRAIYSTNSTSGEVLDATITYQLFITNASYTISGFSGLVSGEQHSFSCTVSNSGESAIIVTGPPTTIYFGSASTNALSIAAGEEGILSFWIRPNLRTNSVNITQQ